MAHNPKTALVTGCSSGIGAALALDFASRGIRVIATARREADLQRLRESHGNITALPLDVRDSESILRLRKDVEQITGGRLDYLVNNAGAHYASTAIDIDIEKAREVFEVNVFAVMQMCETFAPLLITSKGVIVQIGSVTRAVPMIWQSPYNATKAALSQYTKTLRLELAPFGVRVVEVVTAYVQSEILRHGLQTAKDSLYLPIRAHIEKLKSEGNRQGMHASEYAQKVLDRVLQASPPSEIWEGSRAWPIRMIISYLPLWLSDKFWYNKFELSTLEV